MKNLLSTRSNQKTVQLLRFKTLPSDSFLDWNILVIGVNPGYGGGHHAEVEMVGNGMVASGLAF